MKEPTIDEVWNAIERYGIKREMFRMGNPNEETARQIYHMIKESRRKKREEEMIRLLHEWIRNMRDHEKS